MSRHISSLTGFIFWVMLGTTAAVSAAPKALGPVDPGRADALLRQLLNAEERLSTHPTLETAHGVRQAMEDFERILDRYFHAPDLESPSSRPHALALRTVLRQAFSGTPPLLMVRHDLLEFRASLHAALGAVFLRHGTHIDAQTAYIHALSLNPVHRHWLSSLLESFEATKDPRIAAIKSRIAVLDKTSKRMPPNRHRNH